MEIWVGGRLRRVGGNGGGGGKGGWVEAYVVGWSGWSVAANVVGWNFWSVGAFGRLESETVGV